MSSLFVIDFSIFYNGTEADRAKLAGTITTELYKHGAIRLINTSITAETIEEGFKWGKKFFSLSLKEKEAIPNERNANPQRGWSYVGSENTSKLDMLENDGLEDEKEHFDHSSAADTEFPSKWLSESSIPGYRQFMEDLLEKCHIVGREVLENLEQGLGLRKGELRMNYYAPISTQKLSTGKYRRAWPHTDFGMITLLFQDDAGGLEVQDRFSSKPDAFIPLPHEYPTEVLVYVSNSLEYMTNNYLRAGLHQVATLINMQDVANGILPERQSLACFIKPRREVNVGPMKQFITAERPRAYEDLTGLELHRVRVGKLYGAAP
ncbi:iron/ascorbate family oxidoreductase [Zopfia rhizophila CBS 207.26]|uniref:Iron/ascorbate family oxidoreductase n=1 Tax=Zopfia rhizophila CBS 207.26 TaxID=1314779 RepID=A0A6A6EU51_9PEZI|nr:iron/ascorbate family oxidoreductase [Zopfia rhizophila CBS 207.26]